jgi:diketogulonate reductase-like aldo/keto reductase
MRDPKFIYGTAWKEDRTSDLVLMAIEAGFRDFDTANQRKHYFEAAVGEALLSAYSRGLVRREDLFLQTKFTYERGQDHRLPYDPAASLAEQVEQSFASSLEHLHTDYIDSYVLHGPAIRECITHGDKEVWESMESLCQRKFTRHLGLSNVSLGQLELFFEFAKIKPKFVQNRCFAAERWDREVRRFCREHKIIYQGFSLLTANPQAVSSQLTKSLARKYNTGTEQIIFRFAQQIGMCPLTGTSRIAHMKADLACGQFSLSPEELSGVELVGAY